MERCPECIKAAIDAVFEAEKRAHCENAESSCPRCQTVWHVWHSTPPRFPPPAPPPAPKRN